jgi:ATP-dependent helicase/nuclease subunit A
VAKEYTENQKQAIEANGDDICVAAGAGSGKTGVLVERYVRILVESKNETLPVEQRAQVENLLAITFTEKATKELKQRIVQELTQRGLLEERRQLETAYISTIHGFCSRLLQENPFESGVTPGFQVLDEPNAKRLFRQTFETVLADAYRSQDEEVLELVAATQNRKDTTDSSTDPVLTLALSLEHIMGRVRGAGKTLFEIEKHWRQGLEHTSAISHKAVDDWFAPIQQELEACHKGLTFLQSYLSGNNLGFYSTFVSYLENNTTLQETLVSCNDLLKRVKSLRLPRSMPTPQETEAFQYFHRIRIACERAKELYTVQAEVEAKAKANGHRFWGLLVRAWHAYEKEKRALGVLDTEDLQALGLLLLERFPQVRRRYRTRFRHLLVDEFQDTNPIQLRLIELLHKPENLLTTEYTAETFVSTSQGTPRNFLFLVGDVQQSIYAFRNAEPALFRTIERRFREKGEGIHVPLSVNFRSRDEVLQVVRRVFGQIWRQEQTPFVPLTAGLAYSEKATPSLEVILSGTLLRKDYVSIEAEALACRIQQIVEGKELRITAERDPRFGEALEYRDVAVLLRAVTQIEVYEKAFAKRGIPYFVASAGRGYYARHEVRDVMNMLLILDSPLEDVALVSALRSPFVGVDLDTLYHLVRISISRQKSAYSLYRYIPALIESGVLSEQESEKLQGFWRVMEELRQQEDRLPVGHLLERLIQRTSYDVRLLCRPGGRRRLANVRKLLQMANSDPVMGVREFILRLRDLEKISEREGDAPTEEEEANVVKFFTIHKAKGLEFPLVALADLSRPHLFPERRLFTCDPHTLALGTRFELEGDLTYKTLQEIRKAGEQKEAERVLYVAMTRAREHLLLMGNITTRKDTLGDAVFELLGILEPPQSSQTANLAGGIRANIAPTGFYVHTSTTETQGRTLQEGYDYAEQMIAQLLEEEIG